MRFLLGVAVAAAAVLGASPAHAVTKADNTANLDTAGSWTTVAPTNAEIATWDLTVTTPNTSFLAVTAAWMGIKINDPAGAVGISINSGPTLTLGTGGIDLNTATVDLAISGAGNLRLATSATEAFNVPIGRTLTIGTTLSTQGGTTTLNVSGAGNTNFTNAITNSVSPLNVNNTGTGVLTLSGAVTDAVTSLNASGAGALVFVNGATVNAGALSTYGSSTTAGKFEVFTGAANFNGGIRTSATDASLIKVSGGAFSAASVQLQRTQSFTSLPAAASTTSGFIVAGGTASVTGALDIATNNSSASVLVSGGSLTVGGQVTVQGANTTRFSVLQVSGGSFTATNANGIVLSAHPSTVNNSELLLTGGITTTERIGFGVAASTPNSTATLKMTAGTLFVGTGGIVLASGNPFIPTITLANGILGAKADWSSSMAMTLTGGMTLRAADAADVAHKISLSGALTGGGNLTKTGGGALTLAGTAALGSLLGKAGTVVIDTGGTVTTSLFSSIGAAAGDTAAGTVKGAGIWNANGDLNVGDSGALGNPATGTLNVQDTAAVNVSATSGLYVGSSFFANATAVGTVNQTGGALVTNNPAAGSFVVGGRNDPAGTGIYNLSGGAATANGQAYIAGLGTGTLNVSSTGMFTAAAGLRIGNGAAAIGAVNLDGGTINATKVDTGGGASTFNFNGGTLKATAASATFLDSLTAANVKAGGAVIADGGFAISVGQNLLHDPALGGTVDGGLTSSGTATLTLTGASTYTGLTSVAGNILDIVGSINGTASVSVASGGVLLSGASEAINDAAALSLSAGTTLAFHPALSGRTETLTSLSLLGNAVIDFGAGDTDKFAFTGGISGLGAFTLSIYHWSGPAGAGTQDILALGNALTATELGNVRFYSDAGGTLIGTGSETSFSGPAFQIVPVPEPSAVALLGGAGLLHLIAGSARGRSARRTNRTATRPRRIA